MDKADYRVKMVHSAARIRSAVNDLVNLLCRENDDLEPSIKSMQKELVALESDHQALRIAPEYIGEEQKEVAHA
jgi:hypothetical protein